MTKPRKLTKASLEKIVREFDLPSRVNAFLESLGPLAHRRPDAHLGRGTFDTMARYRDWVILTNRGMLGVSVYGDWIACIFDEYDKAPSRYGLHPNGKWNHHSFTVSGHWTDRDKVKQALEGTLEYFEHQIRKMTK